MEVGKELDELIATKVMGWHKGDNNYWYDANKQPMLYIEDDIYNCTLGFCPSTDMHSAWEIVEKLTGPGFTITLKSEDGEIETEELYFKMTYNWEEGYGCWAYFDWKQTADAHPLYGANAPTAPLAICLAALKAVNDDVS